MKNKQKPKHSQLIVNGNLVREYAVNVDYHLENETILFAVSLGVCLCACVFNR